VVEDEQPVAEIVRDKLVEFGHSVVGCESTGENAIKIAGMLLPDLVLMDIALAGKMDGIEAADYIRKNYQIPVIYLTAHADIKTLERVGISAPYGFLLKPFNEAELRAVIEIALEAKAEH
jgi:CheY-like chemotaxis protein